VCIYRNKR